MVQNPVLVVGTTPDYVARLHETCPDPVLFLLDTHWKGHSLLKDVDETLLLFAPLEDPPRARRSLELFVTGRGISPQGVACFDCESLLVASAQARHLGLPFPAAEPILRSRNKFESRRIWKEAGISSPLAFLATNLEETLTVFHGAPHGIVLKPLSGSGSELLFCCKDKGAVETAVTILEHQLPGRRSNPLFRPIPGAGGKATVDPCSMWIAEEFVDGPEFSCDFILENDRLTVIRETGKIKAPGQTFGSVLAYTVPPSYPAGFSSESLSRALKKAVTALGFTWGHFMADFIVQGDRPVIIEMTPRPGGDSIPDLIAAATGINLLDLHLRFAAGRCPSSEGFPRPSGTFASINLYARRNGTLIHIDPARILARPGVKAVFLKKRKGDRVILPPESYDDRLIGYCVVSLEPGSDVVSLSEELYGRLEISFG